MKKRSAIAIIIALIFCVTIGGCQTTAAKTEVQPNIQEKFIAIDSGLISDYNMVQYIMYDPETMVMYTFLRSGNAGSMSVIYNADGTPRLYSPEN